MPVIRDIPLNLKTEDVLRRQGFRGHSKIRPEIEKLILELLASVESEHLLEPLAAYEIYPVAKKRGRSPTNSEAVLQGLLLPPTLGEADGVAAVVCTIGSKLEKQVTAYFSRGEPLRGALLDGIGSAAVDSLCQQACKLIANETSSRGYQASSPVSPGMAGLPIEAQRHLLGLVSAGEIGVSLTSSGMMAPCKSVSMVIGMGQQMAAWSRADVCARCRMRKSCVYRIEASTEPKEVTAREK